MKRDFIIILMITFLIYLSFQSITLVLFQYVAFFGFPAATVGVIWSIIGVARIFAEMPTGVLVDRLGRKPMILIGAAVNSVSYVIFFFSQNILYLFVAASFAGIGFVISLSATKVYTADITPAGQEATYMGTFFSISMAANIIGPTLGTLISQSYGFRVPFVVSFAVAVAALMLSLLVKEIKVDKSTIGMRDSPLQAYLSIFKDKFIMILNFASFLMHLMEASFQNVLFPIYGQSLGLSLVEVGLVVSIGSLTNFITSLTLVKLIEDHMHTRRNVLAMGFIIRGIVFFSFAYITGFYMLAAVFAISNISLGIINSFIEGLWLDITTVEGRGTVFGLRGAFQDLSMVGSPIILTFTMNISLQAPINMIASMAVVQSLFYFIILKPSTLEKYVQRSR